MNAVYLTTNGDTTTILPIPLEVESYGCGVIEMTGKVQNGFNHLLYLCCDICEESNVGNIKIPVLQFINRNQQNGLVNKTIDHVIWLRVMRPTISSIRLYIADEQGKVVSVEDNQLHCTLLFIPFNNKDGS